MSKIFAVGGASDIGIDRERMEDYFTFTDLGDYTTCAVIADGTGSLHENPQPAAIAANHVIDEIKRDYDSARDLLLQNPGFFLNSAFMNANDLLRAFKLGNEEKFSGYFSSMTAIFLDSYEERGEVFTDMFYVHAGSTRLYLLRDGILDLITRDDTEGMALVDKGDLDEESYYTSPECLMLTNWIGAPSVTIQSGSISLYPGDLILMTTDGIHLALRPSAMTQMILESASPEEAAAMLVEGGKYLKYPDNMSAMVIGVHDFEEELPEEPGGKYPGQPGSPRQIPAD